jgi:hypothetical protein
MKKQIKPVSSIIYNGPSLIDGQTIVVVGIIASNNTKTGNMLQTHIIRADVNPIEASKTGADYSICGDCIHRGLPTDNPDKKTAVGRACYVNLGQGPNQVFKAYKAGKYPAASPEEITRLGAKRMIRLGTYGDPAAVPSKVWELLLKEARGHTGYTHQHSAKQAPDYKRLMYSADTVQDAQKAHSKGYRTFRVVSVRDWQDNGSKALLSNEILCPASKENDKGATCIECKLCTGSQSKAKNIAIVAHGATKTNFKG